MLSLTENVSTVTMLNVLFAVDATSNTYTCTLSPDERLPPNVNVVLVPLADGVTLPATRLLTNTNICLFSTSLKLIGMSTVFCVADIPIR